MAEEEKTNDIPEEEANASVEEPVAETNDEEEAVSENNDTASDSDVSEEKNGKSDDEADEVPAKKRDRSKKYLDSKPTNEKKKKEPGKVARWFKDFFSELKKVTWPSFSKVLRQTGTVLLVTVIFLLVLIAFDSLFGTLYKLLIGEISVESVTAPLAASASMLRGGFGLL